MSDPSSKTILVTGGAGFIGQHVVAALRAFGRSVRVLDLGHGRGAGYFVGDVSSPDIVTDALDGVDVVIHLAAIASVQRASLEPELARRTNVDGTNLLLEQSAAAGVKKFIFASSSAVYGNAQPPVSEGTALNPLSLYAKTKVEGERLCESFSNTDFSCVSLRFFNVFGPGQSAHSHYSAVIPSFIQSAKKGLPLVIYGDGLQRRDFIYVDDVVSAIRRAVDFPKPYGCFNIGSGIPISILDLAKKIKAKTNSESEIQFAPGRNGDVRDSWADVSLAGDSLGFTVRKSLDDGLACMVR